MHAQPAARVVRRAAGSPKPADVRARRRKLAPLRDQRDRQKRGAEQERLGHRRALEVEHVRIEHQQRRGDDRRRRSIRSRGGSAARSPTRPPPSTRSRSRSPEHAGAIEPVDLDGERVQQVRQRQPDGADLLPSRRQAVEDAPRDDEVRARVVVREREARAGGSERPRACRHTATRRDRERGAALANCELPTANCKRSISLHFR